MTALTNVWLKNYWAQELDGWKTQHNNRVPVICPKPSITSGSRPWNPGWFDNNGIPVAGGNLLIIPIPLNKITRLLDLSFRSFSIRDTKVVLRRWSAVVPRHPRVTGLLGSSARHRALLRTARVGWVISYSPKIRTIRIICPNPSAIPNGKIEFLWISYEPRLPVVTKWSCKRAKCSHVAKLSNFHTHNSSHDTEKAKLPVLPAATVSLPCYAKPCSFETNTSQQKHHGRNPVPWDRACGCMWVCDMHSGKLS